MLGSRKRNGLHGTAPGLTASSTPVHSPQPDSADSSGLSLAPRPLAYPLPLPAASVSPSSVALAVAVAEAGTGAPVPWPHLPRLPGKSASLLTSRL